MSAPEEIFSPATLGAGVVILHRSQVVLVQPNYGLAKGQWILPGGMVNVDEDPKMAAIREVGEETGLTVKILGLLAVRHRLENSQANVYFVFNGSLEGASKTSEFPSLKWPESELLAARFWQVDEAVKATEVRPLTRIYLKMALRSQAVMQEVKLPSDSNRQDLLFGCDLL